MSGVTQAQSGRLGRHWWRGVVAQARAGFPAWWTRRQGHAPPTSDTGARSPLVEERLTEPSEADGEGVTGATALWRMRTTVKDIPGSLAALCTALAGHRVDILSLQTHPLAEGTVDEFLLRAPQALSADEISGAVSLAGGSATWIERGDTHDLVDAPTRVLGLATRTALDPAELPLALRQLLGRCTIRSLPASALPTLSASDTWTAEPSAAGTRYGRGQESTPAEEALENTVMRLRVPEGGVITVERPHPPFTPTEFARARALVELGARLGPRTARSQDVLTLPQDNEITVRRVDDGNLPAARAMHERCTPRTLGLRYHGHVPDADRFLQHLLSPRFGRTLAAQTASGRLVGLGHLLWDGDETEVALLIEDDWQRRGIGSELLRRLVAMAVEAGCASVYAVTQSSNTGMVAAMRGLGLPLDYQIEEGTLVISAGLEGVSAASPPPFVGRVE